jgi:polar amino acid transport system substrate-binding protein
MYVYHLQPPYALNTATKTGMFFDFADYINSKTERYHFTIVYVPRKRIGSMLKDGKLNGVLLGVNPLWFNDINETKFLWTGSFSEDQDEVVSSVDNSIEYTGADSLSGKVMAGVRGFYYAGISEKVNQGSIVRYDTVGEDEVLQMILLKRVDVGVVSRFTLNYLAKTKGWQNKFYISKQPHDKYQRRILVPHAQKAVYDEILPIVNGISDDPSWKEILRKY